jgi:hypothetical protein
MTQKASQKCLIMEPTIEKYQIVNTLTTRVKDISRVVINKSATKKEAVTPTLQPIKIAPIRLESDS